MDATKGKFVIRGVADIPRLIKLISETTFQGTTEFSWKLVRGKRTLNQNALFHVWVDEISKYLISKNRHKFTPEFTKEMIKHKFLGYETRERIDITTGEIAYVHSLRSTSSLDKWEMYFLLTRVETWALDFLNLVLESPANCEYRTLSNEQMGQAA